MDLCCWIVFYWICWPWKHKVGYQQHISGWSREIEKLRNLEIEITNLDLATGHGHIFQLVTCWMSNLYQFPWNTDCLIVFYYRQIGPLSVPNGVCLMLSTRQVTDYHLIFVLQIHLMYTTRVEYHVWENLHVSDVSDIKSYPNLWLFTIVRSVTNWG